MSVQALKYDLVAWVVQQINQLLLKSECGLLLQVTVNKTNDIVAADIVPFDVALKNGFNPIVGKGKK